MLQWILGRFGFSLNDFEMRLANKINEEGLIYNHDYVCYSYGPIGQ